MKTLTRRKNSDTDFDSPWKEILERYFQEFMRFFFPAAYQAIDWSQPYEFLDKELQKVVRDAAAGRQQVDKLVKVRTTDGTEAWVIAHIEVQGRREQGFARRMYRYNYRLFDKYDRQVATLVVLTEPSDWRPDSFEYCLFGCEVRLKFPVVKLAEYHGREAELERAAG